MARTLEARLATIRAQVGWRLTTLTDKRGRELTVNTLDLLDAWLAWQMEGRPPTALPRRVSMFLAGARMRGYDGEMLRGLQHACRVMWHGDKEVKG